MVKKTKCILLSPCAILLITICIVNGLVTDIGSKRYVIETDKSVNWYQANRACTRLGMSLTSIDSEEEYTNLGRYLRYQGQSLQDYWLSGSNSADPSSVIYTWFSSGNKLVYTKWQDGEPKSSDDDDEDDDEDNDIDGDDDNDNDNGEIDDDVDDSNTESNDDSNTDSSDNSDSQTNNTEASNVSDDADSKARCTVTDASLKWITADCDNETKNYICSRPLVPNCGTNGRCKIKNDFFQPLNDETL